MIAIETKLQACNLCDAMQRNINDNFESISFDINNDGEIQVKIALSKKTGIEEEYIEDLMAEFSTLQERDNVKNPIIVTGDNNLPLSNVVYKRAELL